MTDLSTAILRGHRALLRIGVIRPSDGESVNPSPLSRLIVEDRLINCDSARLDGTFTDRPSKWSCRFHERGSGVILVPCRKGCTLDLSHGQTLDMRLSRMATFQAESILNAHRWLLDSALASDWIFFVNNETVGIYFRGGYRKMEP